MLRPATHPLSTLSNACRQSSLAAVAGSSRLHSYPDRQQKSDDWKNRRWKEQKHIGHIITNSPAPLLVRPLAKQKLRPASLAARVFQVSKSLGVEKAWEMVQRSPRNAQNEIVWNTLIHLALNEEKFELAYSIFTDMKRRGFVPVLATYATLLNGYFTISKWESFPKQLENCHLVYKDFVERLHTFPLKRSNSTPTSKYIAILSRAGLFDKIFEVFMEVDHPDSHIFGAVVSSLNFRTSTNKADGLSIDEQNASDVKLVWRRLEEEERRRGEIVVDDYVFMRALSILLRGRPSDYEFGFELARKYAGLTDPGVGNSLKPKLYPSDVSVSRIMHICRKLEKHHHVIHYSKTVMRRRSVHPRWATHLLRSLKDVTEPNTKEHSILAVDLLKNMLDNNDLDFRPNPKQYWLAIDVCHKTTDWVMSRKIFELISGVSERRLEQRANGDYDSEFDVKTKLVPVSMSAMIRLLQTAFATKVEANMRQALIMYDVIFRSYIPDASNIEESFSEEDTKVLALSLCRLIDQVGESLDSRQAKRCRTLRMECEAVINATKSKVLPLNDPARTIGLERM